MIEVLQLKAIVEAGMQAPSADNMQPWRFVADHTHIEVYIDPLSAHSAYDYRRYGSLVAIGGAIENLLIAARHFNQEPALELFPNKDNPDHVATITFNAKVGIGSAEDAELYKCIFERHTNRKAYKESVPLSANQREALLAVPSHLGVTGRVLLIEEKESRHKLATLFSDSDKMLFLNRTLHDGLYSYFRWNPSHVERTRDRLDIRTLEFPLADRVMVRLLSSWFATRVMDSVGAATMIARKTARIYSTAPAHCAIAVPTNSERDVIQGGRIFERLWLTATSLGLSLHPAFGFAVLGQHIEAGDLSNFTSAQKDLITRSYHTIREHFGLEDQTAVMFCRIGVPTAPPSARSVRKYPENVVTYHT